jgi:prolyl-tRNA editing enzyme YbaK/EbsC (Cys-tRNA(Pro) deacylase)
MLKLFEKIEPIMAKERLEPFAISSETICRYALEPRLLDLYLTESVSTVNNVVWRISNHREKKSPTCEAAPEVRGTPLQNELKTLLLETDFGKTVVNIPATRKLSLNRVKVALGVKNARLADPVSLPFPPGRICALTSPISDFPTLVCDDLFSLKFLTTNDTSTSAFFLFNPYVLTLLKKISIVSISI